MANKVPVCYAYKYTIFNCQMENFTAYYFVCVLFNIFFLLLLPLCVSECCLGTLFICVIYLPIGWRQLQRISTKFMPYAHKFVHFRVLMLVFFLVVLLSCVVFFINADSVRTKTMHIGSCDIHKPICCSDNKFEFDVSYIHKNRQQQQHQQQHKPKKMNNSFS